MTKTNAERLDKIEVDQAEFRAEMKEQMGAIVAQLATLTQAISQKTLEGQSSAKVPHNGKTTSAASMAASKFAKGKPRDDAAIQVPAFEGAETIASTKKFYDIHGVQTKNKMAAANMGSSGLQSAETVHSLSCDGDDTIGAWLFGTEQHPSKLDGGQMAKSESVRKGKLFEVQGDEVGRLEIKWKQRRRRKKLHLVKQCNLFPFLPIRDLSSLQWHVTAKIISNYNSNFSTKKKCTELKLKSSNKKSSKESEMDYAAVPSPISSFVNTLVDFSISDDLFLPPEPESSNNPISLLRIFFSQNGQGVADGDILRGLHKANSVLRFTGLIASEDLKSGGGVYVGDIVDRGSDESKSLHLVERFRRGAAKAGGMIVIMNGDFWFVTQVGVMEFENWGFWQYVGNKRRYDGVGRKCVTQVSWWMKQRGFQTGIPISISLLQP